MICMTEYVTSFVYVAMIGTKSDKSYIEIHPSRDFRQIGCVSQPGCKIVPSDALLMALGGPFSGTSGWS